MTDDELHALLTLMSLKHAGPRRLRALLGVATGVEVVDALRRRQRPSAIDEPSELAVVIPPAAWESWFDEIRVKHDTADLDAHRSGGREILHPEHSAWPFGDDPDPPILAFASGASERLSASPSVAIVGTRRCTSAGRHVAESIGRDLGAAGVTVVSGLALGIDAAAHRGALSVGGAAIGVVASGLDVVYPAKNHALWDAVADRGLLLCEVPLGQRPTKWRFPARNRLIAALSDLVVVVESHETGGALSTVDEANDRGVPVVVVPGSTRSPASDGTNALLVEGATPVRDAVDVMDVLGMSAPDDEGAAAVQLDLPMAYAGDPLAAVLDAVASGPLHLDRVIELLGVSPPAAAAIVDRLSSEGLVVMEGHVVIKTELSR